MTGTIDTKRVRLHVAYRMRKQPRRIKRRGVRSRDRRNIPTEANLTLHPRLRFLSEQSRHPSPPKPIGSDAQVLQPKRCFAFRRSSSIGFDGACCRGAQDRERFASWHFDEGEGCVSERPILLHLPHCHRARRMRKGGGRCGDGFEGMRPSQEGSSAIANRRLASAKCETGVQRTARTMALAKSILVTSSPSSSAVPIPASRYIRTSSSLRRRCSCFAVAVVI